MTDKKFEFRAVVKNIGLDEDGEGKIVFRVPLSDIAGMLSCTQLIKEVVKVNVERGQGVLFEEKESDG